MIVTVVSVANNGDGTYTVTFSEPITNISPGSDVNDPNLLFYSPSYTAWLNAITNAPAIGNAIILKVSSNPTDCNQFMVLDQPLDIIASDLFSTLQPQTLVT